MDSNANVNHSESVPLHQMNPLQRFSDLAQDYAHYRPSYPAAAIAILLEGLGNPWDAIAADVGAGTGISSQLLAEQGVRVWAVEPNAAMRHAAASHPRITYIEGTAEQTPLADASVNLVTCFQAFHWFQPRPSLNEFNRILRPQGRLALIWNVRDCDNDFTHAYTQLIRRVSNNHPGVESMHRDPTPALIEQGSFVHIHPHSFPYQQSLSLEGLIGRASSTSYLPREGVAYQTLVESLNRLHAQWADTQGTVSLMYKTQVYLAEKIILENNHPSELL
jgi:SAM-dependent methyltransferase